MTALLSLSPVPAGVLAAVLGVAAAASSQVAITGVAHTDLVASAGTSQVIPAGTVLAGQSIGSSGGPCGTFPSSSASLSVDVGGNAATYRTYAASYCAGGAAAGGQILLTLSSPVPTAGSLHLDGAFSLSGGTLSVDIGNNGSIEFGTPVSFAQAAAFPLVVDAAGTDVLVDASSYAAGALGGIWASNDLTVTFVPDGIVVPEGAACGAELDARYQATTLLVRIEDFDFSVTGSPVTPHAFFVLGTQALNLVVPPLSCVLRTNIVVALPTVVTPAGEASWTLPVPQGIGPFDIRVQYLAATVQPVSWHTSQAMRLRLP